MPHFSIALLRVDGVVSPRFGATRFSPHLFNTHDDVDRALEVLARVLDGMPAE